MGKALHKPIDFEAIETAARSSALEIAARVVESVLNADTTDYQGSTMACSCGGLATYHGRRLKNYVTLLGKMNLSRAYYYDPVCGHGFFPRDAQLGLLGGSCSPAMIRMIGSTAAEVSFTTAAELIEELSSIVVTAKRVERVAERLGEEISCDEQQDIEAEPPRSLSDFDPKSI